MDGINRIDRMGSVRRRVRYAGGGGAVGLGPVLEYDELTKKVIGAAYRVYNLLGFGFVEKIYENSLMIELRELGLNAKQQEPISVRYRGEVVGEFEADVLVEDVLIVELKSVRTLAPAHEVQLVNYLTATGKPIGLLINFGPDEVQVRRKVRELPRRPR